MAGDDAVAFEVTQPHGKEVASYPRKTVDQVGEAPWPRHEFAHDQQGPAVARSAWLAVGVSDEDDRRTRPAGTPATSRVATFGAPLPLLCSQAGRGGIPTAESTENAHA